MVITPGTGSLCIADANAPAVMVAPVRSGVVRRARLRLALRRVAARRGLGAMAYTGPPHAIGAA